MSLGLIITLIVILGYFSNWLNWRYLNYPITRFLYYIGAFVHELSHAILCVAAGAKIEEFKVLTLQPHVIHRKSKIPFLGEALISLAPIIGGLLFLFLINNLILGDYFNLRIPESTDLAVILLGPINFLLQINLLQWQSWVMILLFVNASAMLGPSFQDLKNISPLMIIFFFIQSPLLVEIALQALSFVLINIAIQLIFILTIKILSLGRSN